MHYRDLLHTDSTVNRAAFDAILDLNTAHEINLALCVDAGLHCPARVPYAEVRRWYATEAAKLDPSSLSIEQRREIARTQRDHLTAIVTNMRAVRAEIAARKAA